MVSTHATAEIIQAFNFQRSIDITSEPLSADDENILRLTHLQPNDYTCEMTTKFKPMDIEADFDNGSDGALSDFTWIAQNKVWRIHVKVKKITRSRGVWFKFKNTCSKKRNWLHLICRVDKPYPPTIVKKPKAKKKVKVVQRVKRKPLIHVTKLPLDKVIMNAAIRSELVLIGINEELSIVKLQDGTVIKLPRVSNLHTFHVRTLLKKGSFVLKGTSQDTYSLEYIPKNQTLFQIKNQRDDVADTTDAPSRIAVSYRLEATRHSAEQAKGAFYDQYLAHQITGHPTSVAHHPDTPTDALISYAAQQPFALHDDRVCQHHLNSMDTGLLLIPGYARQTQANLSQHHRCREAFEKKLIRRARREGRPILAICAGSWRLWQVMGESSPRQKGNKVYVTQSHELTPSADHTASRMPSLRANGAGVGYNTLIHDINIPNRNLLLDAMGMSKNNGSAVVPANSVHWQAIKAPALSQSKHSVVSIMAYTTNNYAYSVSKRTGGIMQPVDGAEAFGSNFGAPILGVQWHPEAFYNNPNAHVSAPQHLNILRYMAKAGDAFRNKRLMLKEFKSKALSQK